MTANAVNIGAKKGFDGPPTSCDDAFALVREHVAYCAGVIEDGTMEETEEAVFAQPLEALAAFPMGAELWRFDWGDY